MTGKGIMGATGVMRMVDRNTNTTNSLRRRGDAGIILITTMLLLVLLAGFAIAAQNRALSQAKVLDRIINVETARIDLQSARAVALPLIGEVLLDGATVTDFDMVFEGRRFEVQLTPAARRDWYLVAITADTSGEDTGRN